MLLCKLQQFIFKRLFVMFYFITFQLDADDRFLSMKRADPHKGAAIHPGMIVEDRLAGYGKQRSFFSHHTMTFSAAEPNPPL